MRRRAPICATVLVVLAVPACGDDEGERPPRPHAAAVAPVERFAIGADGAPGGGVIHGRITVEPVAAIGRLDPNAPMRGVLAALTARADRMVSLDSGGPPLVYTFGPLPENWKQPRSVAMELGRDGFAAFGEATSWPAYQQPLTLAIQMASAPELMANMSVDPELPVAQFVEVLRFLASHGVSEVQITTMTYTAGAPGAPGSAPGTSIGSPVAGGGLDKAIIRRYIKRNIQKIQYCYEKELLSQPSLQGTVQVQFTITPNGTVASSAASGVSPAVSGCVAGVIEAIEFPKPKDGVTVPVNYPFTFRPAGG